MNGEKKSLIFISYSSENKEQVKLLANLLCTINLIPKEDIFCSSLPGYIYQSTQKIGFLIF